MLESVVSTLLNRVLGSYVSNLNYNQLKIGIWSGYLGELTLTIPWSNLRGKPVLVDIKDVYVLAVPRNESTMTAEELAEREQEAKMTKLENSELMMQQHDVTEDTNKNDTFANQLVTRILNNLQFSIQTIHIRYEDNVSTEHRFAAGITLNELSAITTDEEWTPNTLGEAANTIYKLATLESLSIYWDTNIQSIADEDNEHEAFKALIATKQHVPKEHQYILKPVSGSGRVKFNKHFGDKVPKFEASLLFDELSFTVDNEQYRDTILMIDLFHSYLKKQKYRECHPPSHMTPKSHPLEYFRFAGQAILSEIHERNQRWTWDRLKKRRDDRKAYIHCYVNYKLDRATPEELEQLEGLERALSFEDLRFYRSLAKPKLRSEKARLAAIEKRRKEEETAKKAKQGWGISSWWYGSGKLSEDSENEAEEIVITEEQKQEFYDVIDYDADKAAIAASIDLPKDTTLLSLNMTLNRGSFNVRKNPHKQPVDLLSLVFDNFSMSLTKYVESFTATAALGDMSLYDGQRPESPYYKLMGAKGKDVSHRKSITLDSQLKNFSNPMKDPFFTATFEYKPLDERADNAAALYMRNIDIVYNPQVIYEIVEFFTPSETSADSINALIEVAGDTLEGFKKQTRASLKYALEQHTTLDLKVDMDAPVIIIPENAIVIDAGHINVESNLLPPETRAQLKSRSGAEMTAEDDTNLHSLMFDRFTVQLTQTKILVGDSLDTCLVQVRRPRPELDYLHLVDRIDMTFLLELCIIRKSFDMPRLKVSGHLPLLKVNFSDTKYKAIMQLPHLIEASGLLGDKKTEVDLNEYPVQNQADQSWFNLMGNPLWNKPEEEDDMFLLSDSESSDLYTDSLADTVDTEVTKATTVKSVKSSKETVNVEERLFELDFKVDRVLANILRAQKGHRSDSDGLSPEHLLCEVDLKSLKLNYNMRPMDMTVGLSLKSLDVTDRMKHGNEFKYLVTSDQHILQPDASNDSGLKELVNVEYVQCDKQNPEYMTRYKGVGQTVHVTLSTLNFIVTRSSVLTLHSFVMDTFVDSEINSNQKTAAITPSLAHTIPATQASKPSSNTTDNNIYVRLLLDSVNFVLNNDGVRLATGELSLGDLSTVVSDGQVNVAAKFANFTLTDDLSPRKAADTQTWPHQLLTIQGEELIDLKYTSFVDDGRQDYPGYDHAVYLRMGSAQFRFLEEPVHQLLQFLSKFAEMKLAYDMARAAALESAQQLSQAATKMHFDVVIKTPVVLFPEFHQHPSDCVVAHLGEIWASNTFVTDEDGCINTIQAGLRAINLTSKFHFARPEILLQTLPIVDDIDVTFAIDIPEQGSSERPMVDIKGKVSDISMRLTERQYIFLMEAIHMFSRIFTDTDEDEANLQALSNKRSSTVQHRSSQASIQPAAATEKTRSPQIQMAIDAKMIKLEIYMGTGPDLQSPPSLASFALHNSQVNFRMQRDNTMDVFLVIPSLTVDDTRPGINSGFKNIMPVVKDKNQFELQLDLKAPNPIRSGIAMMTIRDSKVILSLDHAFRLAHFFLLPFDNPERMPPVERRRGSVMSEEPAQAEAGIDLSYVIKILNAEFVLLANPDRMDSEAVVLSAEELMITQQSKTALVVKQMGMFLCTMDMRQKSTLRFIQPFDVNLSMNSNPKNEYGGLLTDIVINIDPLVMRVSYRDVMLITDIFNKAFELHNATLSTDKPLSKAAYAQGLFSPSIANAPKELERMDAVAFAQESLRVSFQGAQVILIEELHETPMVVTSLKPFHLEVANWSKNLAASVQLSTYINYFNIKNSHWEPLLEPWNFKLELSRNPSDNNTTHVKLLSNDILNLNVTHTFLESAVSTMKLLDKQRDVIYSGERGTIAPYALRNRTGYRITVWNSTDSNEEPVLKELENGQDMPWWFEDWRKRREMTEVTSNNINVQIDGAQWKSLRDVQLDTEGEHMHPLEPRLENVQHHIVFDVKLVNNVKIVTIRSALVIENRTLLSVDLLDSEGERPVVKIAPGEDYALPIEQAYANQFRLRPDEGFGYHWTQRTFHWKDFASVLQPPSTCSCLSADRSMPPFIFQMTARLNRKSILFGQYPAMAIRLSAPIEIENLLPFDFNFRIVDKTTGQEFSSYLRKGGVMPIHVIENGHLVLMQIEMPDTDYDKSDYAIISTKRTDDLDVDRSFELVNKLDQNKLHIRINTVEVPGSGGAKKYSLFSPYIIINKTGLPIRFKEKKNTWSDAFTSGTDAVAICRPGPKPQPFMYSYPTMDNRNRTLIKVDASDWSRPLSFEAIGSVYDVVLPNGSEEIHVGIHIQEGGGQFKLNKLITLTPRFVLSNQMDQNIRYRVPETKEDYVLEAKQRIPLYNIRVQNEKQLSIKLEGFSHAWSAPFNIQDMGDVHLRLSNDYGDPDMLIRVSILLQEATIFIVLTQDNHWPYLLVNKTDEDMLFYQEDPVLLRDDSAPVRNPRIRRYRLPAHQSVPYSWDLPAYKDKKIILSINGRERSIHLQEIGTLPPFRHASRSGAPAITSIDVKIQGACRLLELTPYRQSESQFKPVNQPLSRVNSMSSIDSAAREGFEVADVDLSVNAVFQIKLKELGISLIDRGLQELVYVTFKGIDLKLTDSALYHSLRWRIDWVQIDNQIYGSVFPILLYPTNSTNNGDRRRNNNDKILPTVQLALDRVKDTSHGVMYFKYFSILLQEMSVELDETLVYAILDFAHVDRQQHSSDTSLMDVWAYSTDIPDVEPHQDIAQIYFEVFSIQPIQFNMSFLRVYQENDANSLLASSAVGYLVNALTMTIGNINNASLKFNALAIENMMASAPDLVSKISIHYSDQFIYQFHRVLGSADFLGNPVGLFNNLSSGVAELFYEPWQGLIMSDRPQDLGYGIAKGFSGFIRKSVFGVSDSFSKFTGSIGKGLSAATMDREYQDRRRMNMSRNRPKHALVGVAQGATSFANSIASGVSGLVARPVEGASREGVGGFIRGVGKGFVGVVTKPVVGVFDFTSNISEGIRNTATPTDTNMIERSRYPRYIGPDGILKAYSLREAIGQHWLKDVDHGKYMQDIYLSHCHVQNDERVAMLTNHRVMLIRTRRLAVEWQEPFSEIQTFKREPTGIIIYLRQSSPERFLIISDKASREEFFKKIESAVRKYNLTRRPTE
ncbi:hypothetical protein RO3G_13643 [Rhizopus delemar RA 99-880]|uniref:Vacuolar protein sorting-associated protein n=1 Tax=Rhizopus delemar (strain RA 99-880 / ATCC MYA-4621 / FGSC 9543 / NRRL 43880) TaxID=246409 RepID=I1CKF2_RHIO9|nr:hypothetical protein RO3G_13643 [Rhizopus delemar RA 99-880]|eukprot:EIE88932.1 hypothetical protein RO3G_13643 [Rhizopus delemar RA 99-880]